ncbi:hypothetical protein [Nostoc sp.]|uniref:hypothetical protein n=1 Tax=Nostoc sp. TaxID=1180 RepID=UPI002FFD2142
MSSNIHELQRFLSHGFLTYYLPIGDASVTIRYLSAIADHLAVTHRYIYYHL